MMSHRANQPTHTLDRRHFLGQSAAIAAGLATAPIYLRAADAASKKLVIGVMGLGRGVISHDLAQYVIEAATGYRNGFWGLLSQGATFKSTGRRRTKPGRAVIAEHRQDLLASEHLAGAYLAAWKAGTAGPVTAALDRAAASGKPAVVNVITDYRARATTIRFSAYST